MDLWLTLFSLPLALADLCRERCCGIGGIGKLGRQGYLFHCHDFRKCGGVLGGREDCCKLGICSLLAF